jgi:hypothetical protein
MFTLCHPTTPARDMRRAWGLKAMALVEMISNPQAARLISQGGRGSRRSAVTNGSRLHVERPGDTKWARRFRDVHNQIIADLLTNNEVLSEGQRQLARRAATIAIVCEKMEGEAAADHDIDLDKYGALTDRLGRTFHRLGLKRQQRGNGGLGELIRADQEMQRRQHQQQSNGADAT